MSALRDVIVHAPEAIGLRALFGVPGGGGNLDLIDAAGRAGLPFVLTATETGGALRCDGTGRGHAAARRVPDDARARARRRWSTASRAPCSIARPCSCSPTATLRRLQAAFEHQRFDQRRSSGPSRSGAGALLAGCAQDTLDQALAAVLGLPPGPVHIDCPEDVRAVISSLPGATSDRHGRRYPPEDQTAFAGFASRAAPAAAHHRSRRATATDDAAAIRAMSASGVGMPAMVTYKAKGVIPDDHPCVCRCLHQRLHRASHRSDKRPDHRHRPRPRRAAAPSLDVHGSPSSGLGRWRVADRHVPFAAQLGRQHRDRALKCSRPATEPSDMGSRPGAGRGLRVQQRCDRNRAADLTRATCRADRRWPTGTIGQGDGGCRRAHVARDHALAGSANRTRC